MENKRRTSRKNGHPMPILFPLALLATAVVFDLVTFLSHLNKFSEAAFFMIAAGLLSLSLASVFSFIDWLAVPSGTDAKLYGRFHILGNVLTFALFAASWLLRLDKPGEPGMLSFMLSLAGGSLAVLTGWLGGELAHERSFGSQPLDASASTKTHPAFPGAHGRM